MSEGHDVGDLIRVEATFRDDLGVLTAPTTVVVTVQAPDGVITTPSATNPSVGVYRYEFVPSLGGNWKVQFLGTGTVQQLVKERIYVAPSLIAP